jgi:hypothetical protein
MTRAVIASLCAVLIAAAVSVADASAAGPDRAAVRSGCIPKKGKTTVLLRTGNAVFFQRTERDRLGSFGVDYACLLSVGKRFRLGVDDVNLNEMIIDRALAGRYVAYARYVYEDLGSAGTSLKVMDLRTGRVVGLAAVETSLESLVLTRSGAIAWSSQLTEGDDGEPEENPQLNKITKLDALGTMVLDCGPGVSVSSLRLSGRRITWQSNGQARRWKLDRPLAAQMITPPSTQSC